MAQRNTSGTNAIPRLVVKIIGSKQVKQFIEEPEGHSEDKTPILKPGADSSLEDIMEAKSPRGLDDRMDSALRTALDKAPNRLCVTAPSGDRSLSYIHQKRLLRAEPKAVARASETTGQKDRPEEEGDKTWLSLAVGEELADWPPSSLKSTEEEVVALDPVLSGTLNQSEITYVFLNNEVPLKLPTFYMLLRMFSDNNCPDQIHYRSLLRFLRGVVTSTEIHHGSKSAARCMSSSSMVPGVSTSVENPTTTSVAPVAPGSRALK